MALQGLTNNVIAQLQVKQAAHDSFHPLVLKGLDAYQSKKPYQESFLAPRHFEGRKVYTLTIGGHELLFEAPDLDAAFRMMLQSVKSASRTDNGVNKAGFSIVHRERPDVELSNFVVLSSCSQNAPLPFSDPEEAANLACLRKAMQVVEAAFETPKPK